MRIALDLGGGPVRPVLAGALRLARTGGHDLRLFGSEEAIRFELQSLGLSENAQIAIHDGAPLVLAPDEDIQAACRENKPASLLAAAACAASGEADALVSTAGPRQAAQAALWHFKRLPGVLKPAAAALIPGPDRPALMLDVGASSDCKPWHLLQFGLMGALFARTVLDRSEPSIRALASGTPATGPSELVREAIPLLKYAGLRFEGTASAQDALSGAADVLVTDGDTGEIAMGSMRGLAELYSLMLESGVVKNPFRRLGYALAKGAFQEAAAGGFGIGAGGTAIFGVAGTVVLCGETPESAEGACAAAVALEGSDFRKKLQQRLSDVKDGLQTEGAVGKTLDS